MQAECSNFRLPEQGDPSTAIDALKVKMEHLEEHKCGFSINQKFNLMLNAANVSTLYRNFASLLNIKQFCSDSESSDDDMSDTENAAGFDTPARTAQPTVYPPFGIPVKGSVENCVLCGIVS